MPIIRLPSIDDSRLAPYRDLKKSNQTRHLDELVVEGATLFERLLASGLPLRSVLLAEGHLADWRERLPDETPVYVLPDADLPRLIGFNFHRGVLAVGAAPATRTIDQLVFPLTNREQAEAGVTATSSPNAHLERPPRSEYSPTNVEHLSGGRLVVAVDIHDPQNVGTILRTAAAFGVDGVILTSSCARPLSRRVLRTSMGAALTLPFTIVDEVGKAIDQLNRDHGFESWAAVVDSAAEHVRSMAPSQRVALVVGNEGEGLPDSIIAKCQRRVTIPMSSNVDSLNVGVATALLLYSIS